MFPLFALKLNKFKIEREDDSTTTLQDVELVAATFIFIFSEKGEIHAPLRASMTNKSSLHFTDENPVCLRNRFFTAVYVVREL